MRVEDHGIGIPLREKSRVYSLFFRGENAIEEEIEGTGLGLYLAKALTRLLNAKISFTSIEGVGTTFTLAFPVHAENKNGETEPAENEVQEPTFVS